MIVGHGRACEKTAGQQAKGNDFNFHNTLACIDLGQQRDYYTLVEDVMTHRELYIGI